MISATPDAPISPPSQMRDLAPLASPVMTIQMPLPNRMPNSSTYMGASFALKRQRRIWRLVRNRGMYLVDDRTGLD